MKIFFDARAACLEVTGVGRIVLETALRLAERGYKVSLLYHSIPNFVPKHSNISIKILKGKSRTYWEQIILPKFLNKEKPDIYHATWNFGLPVFSNIPSVLTVHDVIPKAWGGYFSSAKSKLLDQPLYNFNMTTSVKKSRKVLTDSENTSNDLKKYFPKSAGKTEVCYPGINHKIKVCGKKINQDLEKFGPYFVYLGGIDPRKNIPNLIKAFAELRKREKISLLIVGKYLGQFDSLIDSLRIKDNVIFPGYLDQDSLERTLASAVALVSPSVYEGFGFPVLEAQKAGTAVITGNNSSLPEITGKGGLLIDVDSEKEISEAMSRVLLDKNLRIKLIELGQENIKRFDWEKSTDQVENIYKSIL